MLQGPAGRLLQTRYHREFGGRGRPLKCFLQFWNEFRISHLHPKKRRTSPSTHTLPQSLAGDNSNVFFACSVGLWAAYRCCHIIPLSAPQQKGSLFYFLLFYFLLPQAFLIFLDSGHAVALGWVSQADTV